MYIIIAIISIIICALSICLAMVYQQLINARHRINAMRDDIWHLILSDKVNHKENSIFHNSANLRRYIDFILDQYDPEEWKKRNELQASVDHHIQG